jgi:DnaJ like chaperone protein
VAAVSYQDAMRLLGVSATSEPAQIKRLSPPAQSSSSGQSRRKRATPEQVREATEKTRELHNALC